jgi:hypothetical protein
VALNGQIWVLGGQISSSSYINDVWVNQNATMLGGYYLFQKQ